MRGIIVIALVVVVVSSVAVVASAGQGPPPFDRQPSPAAVVAEHLDALNDGHVDRLMAQYPETVAILLPGGVTSEGRTDVRALFEGFCQPYPAGSTASSSPKSNRGRSGKPSTFSGSPTPPSSRSPITAPTRT